MRAAPWQPRIVVLGAGMSGQQLKCLPVMHEFTRECLAIARAARP
jgi:hypothetical protein